MTPWLPPGTAVCAELMGTLYWVPRSLEKFAGDKGQTSQTWESWVQTLLTLSHHLVLIQEQRLSTSEFFYCFHIGELSSTHDGDLLFLRGGARSTMLPAVCLTPLIQLACLRTCFLLAFGSESQGYRWHSGTFSKSPGFQRCFRPSLFLFLSSGLTVGRAGRCNWEHGSPQLAELLNRTIPAMQFLLKSEGNNVSNSHYSAPPTPTPLLTCSS